MNTEREQIASELHRPARRVYKRRHVIVKKLDETWEIDLVDMQQYSKQNKNFRYLLTAIDTFSKFGFGAPIKDKRGPTVSAALENIFEESGRKPEKVHSDRGGEFYNSHFKNLMTKHDIHHFSTFSDIKVRFNLLDFVKMKTQLNLSLSRTPCLYHFASRHQSVKDLTARFVR